MHILHFLALACSSARKLWPHPSLLWLKAMADVGSMASTFTEEEEEAEMTDAELREALILYYEKVTKPGFTFSMEVLGDPDGTMTAMVHGLVKEFAGEVEAEEICLHDPYGEPEKDEAGEDKREELSLADREEIYEAEEEGEEEEEEEEEEEKEKRTRCRSILPLTSQSITPPSARWASSLGLGPEAHPTRTRAWTRIAVGVAAKPAAGGHPEKGALP